MSAQPFTHVDQTVAYCKTTFAVEKTATSTPYDAGHACVDAAIEAARAAGRRPVMIEVIVRVAP